MLPQIDNLKEKREIPMIGIGNKNDAPKDPKFEMVSASAWAQREKSELSIFS